jgi:hypothetical protein
VSPLQNQYRDGVSTTREKHGVRVQLRRGVQSLRVVLRLVVPTFEKLLSNRAPRDPLGLPPHEERRMRRDEESFQTFDLADVLAVLQASKPDPVLPLVVPDDVLAAGRAPPREIVEPAHLALHHPPPDRITPIVRRNLSKRRPGERRLSPAPRRPARSRTPTSMPESSTTLVLATP